MTNSYIKYRRRFKNKNAEIYQSIFEIFTYITRNARLGWILAKAIIYLVRNEKLYNTKFKCRDLKFFKIVNFVLSQIETFLCNAFILFFIGLKNQLEFSLFLGIKGPLVQNHLGICLYLLPLEVLNTALWKILKSQIAMILYGPCNRKKRRENNIKEGKR